MRISLPTPIFYLYPFLQGSGLTDGATKNTRFVTENLLMP